MKGVITAVMAALVATGMAAQELPQFSQTSFEGWTYTRDDVELNTYNISTNRIYLYYNADISRAYTLLSPSFDVDAKVDSIVATVTYHTPDYDQSNFVLRKTALTLATIDDEGYSRDSTTVVPTVKQRTHTLRVAVPHRKYVERERLRLAGWDADVNSCGAVRTVTLALVSNFDRYDVNNDQAVDVGDVNTLLEAILAGDNSKALDLNGDGTLDVGDVNLLLEYLLNNA